MPTKTRGEIDAPSADRHRRRFVARCGSRLRRRPGGEYLVQGTNPGSASSYRGTVRVERTGDTFRVTWVVGGTRYVGTGIGDKNFIAVSYRAGNDTGLALYGADGGDWKGVWTYANGRQVGTETWKRD